jgi:hypothetical protein
MCFGASPARYLPPRRSSGAAGGLAASPLPDDACFASQLRFHCPALMYVKLHPEIV